VTDQTNFDIAVIGGGIHGAGVAQAAAAAGFATVVIEKSHWAAGTSSKSSKLIHGGLRYLQQRQFRLVRESLRERNILCTIAPHLVALNRFYIPVYRDSRYRPWQLRLGLSLYTLLGGLQKEHRFFRVPKSEWSSLSQISTENLQAVYCFQDAQTDDRKLTEAVIQSAASLGAHLLCPARLESAESTGQGYKLSVGEPGRQRTLHARVLVNAAGPWVNLVAEQLSPQPPMPAIDLVQGTHLVLDRQLSQSCFYLESPEDGRAVFVLPWHGRTLLGTTETRFEGSPDQVAPLPDEERYLLNVLQTWFPAFATQPEAQVVERMAGLRVLPDSDGRPFARSREVNLVTDDRARPAYIAIYGGKLTGYRATAEKVIALARKNLGPGKSGLDTAGIRLPDPSG